MRNQQLFILIMIAATGLGCEEIIDFPFDEPDPQMIVYATLKPDEVLELELFTTLPIVGSTPDSFWVDDADVWLFSSQEDSLSLIPLGNGRYQSKDTLRAGRAYALKAYHHSLPTLSTEYIFLSEPPEIEISIRDSIRQTSPGLFESILSLTLPDSVEENILFLSIGYKAAGQVFNIPGAFLSESSYINCTADGNLALIDLQCTNTRTLTIIIPEYYQEEEIRPLEAIRIYTGISSQSKYDFYRAVFQEQGFELGISDPVKIPSGIKNGIGYWGIESGQIYRIER